MSHHESTSEDPVSVTAKSGGSIFLTIAGILLVILIVIFGALMLGNSESPTEKEDAARAAVRTKNLAELQAADAVVLNSSEPDDGFDGGHIPITKAMELIVPILNAKSAAVTTEPSVQKQP
jgi:hypothetical protein